MASTPDPLPDRPPTADGAASRSPDATAPVPGPDGIDADGIDEASLRAALVAADGSEDGDAPEDAATALAALLAPSGVEAADLAGTAGGIRAARAALAEVAADLAALGPEEREAPPSDHVRAAARAAWRAHAAAAAGAVAAVPSGPGGDEDLPGPERVALLRLEGPARRRARVAWVRVAALLLLAVGVGLVLRPRAEAQAGLDLLGVDRLDGAGGRAGWVGGHRAPLGERFQAGAGERLALHLAGEGGAVLRAGDALEVAPLGDGAVLRLVGGEVRLAATTRPVRLELGSGEGLLVLRRGAAHVALAASGTGPDAPPALALDAGASAVLVRPGRTDVELHGPTHVLVRPDGPVALGAPARALFADLAFLGGELGSATTVVPTGARRWRIAEGAGHRTGPRLVLRPDGQRARLAWRPGPELRRAASLVVDLEGPPGLAVSVPGVGSALLPAEPPAAPGLGGVQLVLPAGWWEALGGGELVLEITWPGSSEDPRPDVRFDGVAFRLPAAPTSGPSEGRP